MRSRRWTVLLSLLLVGILMMSACAPRPTGGGAPVEGADVVVDLPALVVDIQVDGSLKMGDMALADLGAAIGQGDALAAAALSPDQVQQLVANKIQHISIENTPEGLLLLVNNKAIPTIAWDGDALVTTAEVIEQFGIVPIELLDRLLPLITNLGIGFIIRAPLAEGAEPIPVGQLDETAAEEVRSAQAEFLSAVITPPTFSINVNYAPDGSYEIAGISQEELSTLLPDFRLNDTPEMLAEMQAMGISQLSLATNEDGLFISINGKRLPYLSWADGRVSNVLALAAETGMLDAVAPPNMDMDVLLGMVESVLPSLLSSQVSVNFNFP